MPLQSNLSSPRFKPPPPPKKSRPLPKRSYSKRAQLLLSDRFSGFFLVPDAMPWNYNFMGVRHSATMPYSLRPGVPREFYHPSHRPAHFLEFSTLEAGGAEPGVDVEDPLA